MLDDRAVTAGDPFTQTNCVNAPTEHRCRLTWISRWGMIATLQVAEVLVVATASFIWLAMSLPKLGSQTEASVVLAFAAAVAMLVHFGLRYRGTYDFVDIMRVSRSCKAAASAWVLSTGALVSIALLFAPTGNFRETVIVGWLVGGLGLVLVRLIAGHVSAAFVRTRWLRHNIVIIGTGLEAQRCASLLGSDGSGANVIGLMPADRVLVSSCNEDLDAVQLSDLQRLINANEVKDVIIGTALHEQPQLPALVKSLHCLPVRVFLWPPSLGVEAGWLAGSDYRIGNMPLFLTGVPALHGWHWVVKDVRDRVLAFLLLILTSPLLLAIVLMIRLTSPGPVLFRQQREGYGGNMFTIFKFRTMRVSESPTSRMILTTRNDPRVFPVGTFLRKTSLDELPQLLNVLRGDMWLVGPRPHSPLATAAGQRYSAAISGYLARLRVKPGITGWAQVNGWRGPTTTLEQIQQRFTYDLYYIQHLSTSFDLRILIMTVTGGFVHKNAF